jgi:hypothetical protein
MLTPSTDLIAIPTAEARPCGWCKRPTVWTYRQGEREVAACRPICAEKALRQDVTGQGPNHSEAVAGSRLNPWGHSEAYPVRESCHANSEKPIARQEHGYKQGSGRERLRGGRK